MWLRRGKQDAVPVDAERRPIQRQAVPLAQRLPGAPRRMVARAWLGRAPLGCAVAMGRHRWSCAKSTSCSTSECLPPRVFSTSRALLRCVGLNICSGRGFATAGRTTQGWLAGTCARACVHCCMAARRAAASWCTSQIGATRIRSSLPRGSGEPSPGADVAGPSPAPISAPGLGSALPHLHRGWAYPSQLGQSTSVPGLASCEASTGCSRSTDTQRAPIRCCTSKVGIVGTSLHPRYPKYPKYHRYHEYPWYLAAAVPSEYSQLA
jgi:hypothetical protein